MARLKALTPSGRQIIQNHRRATLSALRTAEDSGLAITSLCEYFPTMDSLITVIFEDCQVAAHAERFARIAALPPSATLPDSIRLTARISLPVACRKARFDPVYSLRL